MHTVTYQGLCGRYEFRGPQVLQREAPFLAWCLDQGRKHPDRRVDHSSWEDCAIGDFAREVQGHTNLSNAYVAPAGYEFWNDHAREHIPSKLYEALDRGSDIYGRYYVQLQTYGGLAELITDWYVIFVIEENDNAD